MLEFLAMEWQARAADCFLHEKFIETLQHEHWYKIITFVDKLKQAEKIAILISVALCTQRTPKSP